MTRTRSTYLALISVLLSPMAANADLLYQSRSDIADTGDIVSYACSDCPEAFVYQTFDVFSLTADSIISGFDVSELLSDAYGLQSLEFSIWTVGGDGLADSLLALWDIERGDLTSVLLSDDETQITSYDGLAYALGAGDYLVSFFGDPMAVSYWSQPGGGLSQCEISGGISVSTCSGPLDFTLGFNINGTTAVPEPGTLALLGIGLAALGLTRRRKAA